jgi:hypothetical protein
VPHRTGPQVSNAADSQSPAVLLGLIQRVSGPGQAREKQTSNGNDGKLHDDIRVDEKSQLSLVGRGNNLTQIYDSHQSRRRALTAPNHLHKG